MEPFDVPAPILGQRDIVAVDGPDALTYLHSQVSQDVRPLQVGERTWTFLLDPAGKVLVLAGLERVDAERFELDTDAGFGAGLLARLDRFKIRVKATTTLTTSTPGSPIGVERDESARIAFGWPAMGAELVPGESMVAGTGLARIAVSFTKGCYPGQELVERMDSRVAVPPRSIQRVSVAPGTVAGDPVTIDGVEVGEITSVVGTDALAWIKRGSEVGTPVAL